MMNTLSAVTWLDHPVAAEEKLSDRLVAELGHHAAAVGEFGQRVRRAKALRVKVLA